MQKDLFGKKIVPKRKRTKMEIALQRYDKKSFGERLERLNCLNKIFPKEFAFSSDLETLYIFNEVKMAFVGGEFISTILLSQAFIERRFQAHYSELGLQNTSNKGLKAIIDHAKKNGTIHTFLIGRVDELRKKRNPFVHLKEYEHEYNLSQRMYKSHIERNEFKEPSQILMEDAKEAISLMYAVLITDLK
jgi:hypothetical protein